MKKWLAVLGSGIATLLVLLILACYYLFGTESGAVFLASQAQKQLGSSLVIGETRGKVLDRLEFDDILFISPATGKIRLKHLILDWKSSDLLHLNFHIQELSASGVSYTPSDQKGQEKEPKSNLPIVLPDLILPITIGIEKLAITDFSFIRDQDKSPLRVDSATLSLNWNKTGITLQQLTIQVKEGELTLRGKLNPQGSYPVRLTSSLTSRGPDLPNLDVRGSYNGDIRTLDIQQSITGDIAAELQISLKDILEELGWNVNLQIDQLQPALLAPDVPGLLQGSIAGSGSLHKASATANLHIRSREDLLYNWDAELDLSANLDTLALDIKKLSLRRPETTTRIELSGLASLEQTSKLSLHWTDIQWPLSGPAQVASATGTIKLNGTLDDYRLKLSDSSFSGSMLPAGQLSLSSHGNSKGASNLSLRADLLHGTTSLQGDIQWAPFFKWQLTSTATNIDPGQRYVDWPGRLQWKIESGGSLNQDQLNTELKIESLQGSLRDLPLAGSGTISLRDKNILVDSVTLSSAGSVLTADGNLGDDSNLDWKINIMDLSDLLPGGRGTLHAEGSVQGMMERPRLELQLLASSVSFQDLALQKLTTDASLDLSWQNPFSVKLQGTDLHFGQNLIQNVTLRGSGSRETHNIHLDLKQKLATLSLGLKGGYQQESWQGTLEQFDILSKDIGSWQLQHPVPLQASTETASLQETCLKREDSALCFSGSWDAGNGSSAGDVTISSIPLRWLSPWLPEPVEELGGFFSARATAKMQETLQADVTAEITPGDIKYATARQSGSFPHQGMKLDLKILKNALDASLSLAVDSNSIQAHFSSPDILHIRSANTALSGSIKVDARKFDLVEVLVPAVQNLDAAIDINLGISGTVQDPKVTGSGTVSIPYVFIPPAGLELRESSLDLQSTDTELRLKGQLNSPDGSMDLDGWVILDSSQNFPLQLSLKSENFRLINLPEMRIFLSSDLLLKREPELTSLLGELTIPRAEILLRQLPTGSQSVSPDVVILQETKVKEPTAPIRMDIKATLGKNVHFSGFGLNAFINGQLNILSEPGEQMLGSGSFSIDQGSFRAYGQDLDIETGVISFPGGPLTQPGIDLRATRTIGDVIAGIYAIGPVKKPRITTFSRPPMSESYIISYLLTGSAPSDAGKGAKLSIGRQINDKLSVSLATDVKTGDSEFVTRYRLNRNIHIQTTTGGNGNAVDIFYSVELGGAEQEQGGKGSPTPPE